MGKAPDNPDGPDEIQKVHFLDYHWWRASLSSINTIISRGGRSELLKVDELCLQMLEGLFRSFPRMKQADRFGIVSVDFAKFGEYCKN